MESMRGEEGFRTMFGYLLRCWAGMACALLAVLALSAPSALAKGDANMGECPNEALVGFREALPDCRAYEQVTPPFKAGGEELYLKAISGDGSRLVAVSLGGFAGAEKDFTGARYQFVRSGSGWQTSAISPPASRFPASQLYDLSPDLTRSVWAAREGSQSIYAEDMYLREPDGRLVKVGPIVNPAGAQGPPAGSYADFEYEGGGAVSRVGASSDLSHVLFMLSSYYAPALWPGDTTQYSGSLIANSLYEYVGTGNTQPILVGADAGGHLISSCGTTLGSVDSHESYRKDVYNAISGDGETVFFTAVGYADDPGCTAQAPEVNEVYARVGQAPGGTVAISEPSEADCGECQVGVARGGHPAVAEAAAVFQGASQDGSKVFFLTGQELFAGATGENLYEYDFDNPAGEKVVRVSAGSGAPEVFGVARVSEDGSHVYFVAGGLLTGANGEGRSPVPHQPNLYVFERDAAHPAGKLTFVATLSGEDQADWTTVDSRPVQATPDGRFLVFQSFADLTPGDTSSTQQVFEYDAAREELARVSVGEAGYGAGAVSADAQPSFIPVQIYATFEESTKATTGLAVSADGRVVMFTSAAGLTPAAAAASEAEAASVYEYRSSGSLASGGVHLLSDGSSVFSARPEGVDPSGQDAFLYTAEPLAPTDVDTQFDLYDARALGGFPAPAAPVECEHAASCQGPVGVAPGFGVAGSVSAPGGEDLTPPPPPPPAPPMVKPPARAQLLAKALRVCRGRPRGRRAGCEARARRRYGANSKRKGRG